MANVLFKRGLSKDLKNLAKQDGVFYLTTDTGRLYIDINNERKLLNQTVQFVDSLETLENAVEDWTQEQKTAHINDIYYITGTNILATWNGVEWKQINPDHNTLLETLSLIPTSATANQAQINLTALDTDSHSVTASFGIKGTNGVTVGVDNGELTISGDPYTLSANVANSGSKLNLVLNSGTTTAVVPITSTGNIIFSSDANGININSENNIIDRINLAMPTTGSLAVSLIDNKSVATTATLEHIGIGLNDGTFIPIINTNGKTQGSVYSKTEIDSILSGLDGMTYKGTLGDGDTLPLAADGVKNGDVYVITVSGQKSNSSIFTGATFNAATLAALNESGTRVGDMVIARGTESVTTINNVTNSFITSNLEWTYVPAGNDSLDAVNYQTTITPASNTLYIENNLNEGLAKIVLNAGTDMVVTSSTTATSNSTDNTLLTTISHATYNAVTPTTATTLSDRTSTFTAIKNLTLTNGHVTGITTDTYTPVTYELTGATATAATTASAQISIGLKDSADSSMGNVSFSLNSDSINFSAANNAVTMNMVWGTF